LAQTQTGGLTVSCIATVALTDLNFVTSSSIAHDEVQGSEVFEVFTAVTMKNTVFWNAAPCASCKNLRSGGTYHLHHQGDMNRRARSNVSSNYQLKFTYSYHPGDGGHTVLLTLALRKATRRNIPENCILHSHRRENVKSYAVS
jgi:hypothetical protein